MPIIDYKIEAQDYTGHDVASLSDTPSEDGVSADDLQERFDSLVKEVVVPAYNGLIDALGGAADGNSGADSIGCTAIDAESGETVQVALEWLKTQIVNAILGQISDGSILDDKLSADAGAILARFAAHAVNYGLHTWYLGNTGGTASAYTVTAAGFNAANATMMVIRAHADCSAGATLTINSESPMTIKPGTAASLAAAQMKANGAYLLLWYPVTSTLHLLNPETVSLTLGIGDITNLQTTLDGKAASAHQHTIVNVTGLDTALAGKALLSHSHVMDNITNLVSTLAGKSDTSHNHSGVYQPAGSYAASSHNHDGVYSAYAHNHSGVYQPAGSYAAASHGHSSLTVGDVSSDVTQVVNVYYSTSATPPASAPNGTIFIQYTA